MNTKILTALVVVLALIVVVETVYLFNFPRSPLGYVPYRHHRVQWIMPVWPDEDVFGYNNFDFLLIEAFFLSLR
jgi:hypothetical protein